MKEYNLYFGTFAGDLQIQYRYTVKCKTEDEVKKILAKDIANFYYRNEGTHHIPSYVDINRESTITRQSIEKLYNEHINDLIRSFYIPTELDTVSKKDLVYN